jgi:hypothetical protein
VALRPAESKELGQVGSRIAIFPSESYAINLGMLGIKEERFLNRLHVLARASPSCPTAF